MKSKMKEECQTLWSGENAIVNYAMENNRNNHALNT